MLTKERSTNREIRALVKGPVGVGPGHRDEAIGEHIAVWAKHTPPWRTTIAAATL